VLILSAARLRSSDIVPGDLVVVEPNTPVPCDMIVLSGSIVVNESSLTGESIPVLKSPLPNDDRTLIMYLANRRCANVLYRGNIQCGTQYEVCFI
jgi:cation-transporting ATPase 13A2